MNLETMRTTFKQKTAGMGASLSNDEIDVYLNRFYTQVIPADVDGLVTQVVWTETLTIGTGTIDMPNEILTLPQGVAWIELSGQQYFLNYYDEWARFLNRNPGYATDTGRPTALLLFGRQVIFDKLPDAAYEFKAQARGAQAASVPSIMTNDIHALAVVHGAVWEFLLDVEDHEGAAREGNRYETYKKFLIRQSHGNRKRRTAARSF